MPPNLNAPLRTMLYQASTAMNGDLRRSGTTPPPTAAWPWQTLQKRLNSASPVATVAASATSGGGATSAGSAGSAGSVALPPSLNTSTRLTLSVLPDLSDPFPCMRGYAPPQPDNTAIYCSPSIS